MAATLAETNALRRAIKKDPERAQHMLATSPHLLDTVDGPSGMNPFHFAAFCGRDDVVATILRMRPTIIDSVVGTSGYNALHCAASNDADRVVAQLLAVSPNLIDTTNMNGETPLHLAVIHGSDRVVARLLAANPASCEVINTVYQRTVLHYAIKAPKVMKRLLEVTSPELLRVMDHCMGQTALHRAVAEGRQQTAEMLLARMPEELGNAKDATGNTSLHLAVRAGSKQEFVRRIWEMNHSALRDVNIELKTPFAEAIERGLVTSLEMFQWVLTFDEIVDCYAVCNKPFQERYRSVMEQQCEVLPQEGVLNPDVVTIVFEYLGFEPRGRAVMSQQGLADDTSCVIHS